jgi:hypothetical protein
MDRSKLLETLEFLKDKRDTDVVIKFILKFKKLFTPEDWYNIVNHNLIRAELIKDKKEVVYDYIKNLGGEKASTIIDNATKKDTYLGKFFYTKRGFFDCNENSGTLKKLNDLKAPRK